MSVALSLNKDGSEQLTYNAPGLPVRFASSALSVFFGHAAACHWHHDYEMLQADRGGIDYFVNGQIVHVKEGQAIFVNSNRLHYGFSAEGQECLYRCLVFHPSLFGEPPLPTAAHAALLSADHQRDYWLLDPAGDAGKRMPRLFDRIGELCAERAECYEFAVQGACGELFSLLFQAMRPEAGGEARDPAWQVLRKMSGYVQAHYEQGVQLKDIAAAGAVCRSRCCALFRHKLNQTPMEYLTQYRLEKARQLLSDPSLTVTQIAGAVGFSGASYFAEQFRRSYGTSPREFRAMKAYTSGPASSAFNDR